MLKSYFILALRNLLKQRTFSFIKIAGLAFGLATSMIIYLYIREDLSYDQFHSKHEKIVRLLTIDNAEGVSSKLVGVTQPRLGPAAAEELPEVVQSVRLTGGGQYDLSYDEKSLKCKAAFRVDPSFFSVFDFKVIDGPTRGILDEPGSIAITQSLAGKIFGNENPVGKTIKLNQTIDLHIVSVLADPPKNSHLQFDLLHTLVPGQNEQGLRQALETWQGIFAFTYLLLDKPANIDGLNLKLQEISKKNNAFEFFTPVAQNLDDIHLHSKGVLFEVNNNKSDITNVYVLSIISVLILILAAVNFTNLVTANATMRAKEIGMRKVIGAVRSQLVFQHLAESILITTFSAALAVAATFLVLPSLNSLYNRFVEFTILLTFENILVIVALIIIVGLMAGLYPAFVLSWFRPVHVLKGTFKSSPGGIRLRKALVILQFTISIALMVGTGIVYQQMNFIFKSDLGYNRDQVITIQQNGGAISRASILKTELLKNVNIISAGTSSTRIGQQLGRTNIIPEGSTAETNIITSVMATDEQFIPTMEMRMAAGRNFSIEYGDSLSMIINEEMVRLLQWGDPIGRKISLQNGPDPADLTHYTVIGVVKDFHFATIRHKLEPMFMLYNPNNSALAIRVKAQNMSETLAFIEETWRAVNPGTTFDYAFLDDQFAALYNNEVAFKHMFSHFTILAMTIAGLGLFALSAYTAEQRKKEIGIRKILGASSTNIFYKLSIEYVGLVSISFVLASISSYLVMTRWLQDFQYSISISAGIFVFSGVVAILIALLTISFQAIRAAVTNPINSLRTE